MNYDVVVIGAGPAGLTAGIFAVRRGMKTLVLGDPESMSQTGEATTIDNWPGIENIRGTDLVKQFTDHAKKIGVAIENEKIISIKKNGKEFSVNADSKKFLTKTVIIATGLRHRKGMIKGETEFSGKGVSYCAACDAPLFKGKRVLYIGGGDSAVMGALLSSRVGSKTILIHRRDKLRAVKSQQEKILKSNVKIMWNTVPVEIKGDKFVKSIVVADVKTKKEHEIEVDAVFVTMGTVPTAEIAKGIGIKTDKKGFIVVDKEMKTSVPGIFAAGDCTNNPLKQIVTAAGDGAIAATSAYYYFHNY